MLGRFADAASHTRDEASARGADERRLRVGMAHLTAGRRLLAKGDWILARPSIERGT